MLIDTKVVYKVILVRDAWYLLLVFNNCQKRIFEVGRLRMTKKSCTGAHQMFGVSIVVKLVCVRPLLSLCPRFHEIIDNFLPWASGVVILW